MKIWLEFLLLRFIVVQLSCAFSFTVLWVRVFFVRGIYVHFSSTPCGGFSTLFIMQMFKRTILC